MGGSSGCCFIAGTKVLSYSRKDWVDIETVGIGELLISHDVETGEYHAAEVVELVQPLREAHYKVRTSNGLITGFTDDHPFWDPRDKVWRAVDNVASMARYPSLYVERLFINDHIQLYDGSSTEVVSIEYFPGEVQTYSFVLGTIHTYFANGLLTHNRGGGSGYTTILVAPTRGTSGVPGITLSCALNLYNYGIIVGSGGGGGGGTNVTTSAGANAGGRGAGYGVGWSGQGGAGYGGSGGAPGAGGGTGGMGTNNYSWVRLGVAGGGDGAPAIRTNGCPFTIVENTGSIVGGYG